MLCKTGNASVDFVKLSSSGGDVTYTTSQAYGKLYISVYGTFNTSHRPSGSSVSSSCFMRSTIYVNNVEVWQYQLNSYADSGTIIYDQMAELSDVPSGATIKMTTTLYGSRSTYNYVTGTLTYTIPGNLPVIIRPLIPQVVEEIGNQTVATSYGQLDNGQRYGEFPAENSNSATAGSITLGNCVGFKTIIDNGGNKRKIPVYKE